jgi:putative nucleotidyltransferase with HDIG domain
MGVAQGIDFGLDGSTAFTIGLLHDIGKLVTSHFLTRHLVTCIKHEVTRGISALEAERNVLQTDHAEVGASLLYLWRLPDIIVEAVGLHHSPPSGNTICPAMMAFFANRVAHQAVAFLDQSELTFSREDERIFEGIGFSGNQLQDFIESVVESSAETDDIVAVCC